jgi:hypothetical protein
VKSRGGVVVLVHGRVKEVLARGLEFVLLLQRVEQAGRRSEVRNASRHGNASASNDYNLALLVENIQ